jgi:hypothetical protein
VEHPGHIGRRENNGKGLLVARRQIIGIAKAALLPLFRDARLGFPRVVWLQEFVIHRAIVAEKVVKKKQWAELPVDTLA